MISLFAPFFEDSTEQSFRSSGQRGSSYNVIFVFTTFLSL